MQTYKQSVKKDSTAIAAEVSIFFYALTLDSENLIAELVARDDSTRVQFPSRVDVKAR